MKKGERGKKETRSKVRELKNQGCEKGYKEKKMKGKVRRGTKAKQGAETGA